MIICIQDHELENVICRIANILSKPRKQFWVSNIYGTDTLNIGMYIINCCTIPISTITGSGCLIKVSNHYIDPRGNLAWDGMLSLSTHASVTIHTLTEDLWDCRQSHWNGKVLMCRMKLTAYKRVGHGWNQPVLTKKSLDINGLVKKDITPLLTHCYCYC